MTWPVQVPFTVISSSKLLVTTQSDLYNWPKVRNPYEPSGSKLELLI
jgi:hypothetical protein